LVGGGVLGRAITWSRMETADWWSPSEYVNNAQRSELGCCHELAKSLEVLGGLAGESDDNAVLMEARNVRRIVDQLEKISPDAPRFMRSTPGRGMRKGHVDILQERWVLGDGVEQLRWTWLGVRIEKANPLSCRVSIAAAVPAARPSHRANPGLRRARRVHAR